MSDPHSSIGEQRLLAAVLQDAKKILTNEKSPKHKKEAIEWFASSDQSYPFSFLSICELLDIDPARLRRELGLEGSGT